MERLPLFPLGVVLFPGMPLRLRVFEPRYHELLRDCEAAGQGFGVVLIKEGPEVGGPAVPHGVGTLARIEQRVDEGGVAHLLVRGTRRFRVLRAHGDKPYLSAEVAWLEEPVPDPAGQDDASAVAGLFEEYLQLLARLTRTPLEREIADLMQGQRTASAWARACAIGGTLLVAAAEKQPILEARTVREALRAEQALLARETARLRVLARSVDARLN